MQELIKIKANAKQKAIATTHKSPKKKKSSAEVSADKIDLTNDVEVAREVTLVNGETVSKQVQGNLWNWATKQSEINLKQLQEDEHYSLKISLPTRNLKIFQYH